MQTGSALSENIGVMSLWCYCSLERSIISKSYLPIDLVKADGLIVLPSYLIADTTQKGHSLF